MVAAACAVEPVCVVRDSTSLFAAPSILCQEQCTLGAGFSLLLIVAMWSILEAVVPLFVQVKVRGPCCFWSRQQQVQVLFKWPRCDSVVLIPQLPTVSSVRLVGSPLHFF